MKMNKKDRCHYEGYVTHVSCTFKKCRFCAISTEHPRAIFIEFLKNKVKRKKICKAQKKRRKVLQRKKQQFNRAPIITATDFERCNLPDCPT